MLGSFSSQSTVVFRRSEIWQDIFAQNHGLIVHLVCFISNVYKQRFFKLVEFFENLSNRTSLFLNAKQHIKNTVASLVVVPVVPWNHSILRKVKWNHSILRKVKWNLSIFPKFCISNGLK